MKSILLIGLNRFGSLLAKQLYDLGRQIMAVDKDEARVNEILPLVTDAQIGDSTNEAFLRSLGVNNYDVCIVAIGGDFQSSLETTSLLKELGGKLVVSRADRDVQTKFLLRNGADAVVFPERELGYWTAIRYSSENISDYVELSDGYAIFEIKVPDRWSGKRIVDLDVRRKFHINILGIRSPGQSETFSRYGNGVPNERPKNSMNMDVRFDTVLNKGETLLVLGLPEHIQKVL